MTSKKQPKARTKKISNEDLLRILLQEIADVRYELKQDISEIRADLKTDIAVVRRELQKDIADARKELQAFRMESHQNQVSFITNIQDHEKRIVALEQR